MKLFGMEIRKADNQPDVYRKNYFYTNQGELPETTIDVFFRYFKKNSDIRRCIIELQESVGVEGYGYQQGEEVVYDIPKIDDKIKNFQELKRRVIRDVAISGNAFIVKLRNGANKIIGYTTIDPRTVKIVADNTGEVMRYIQFLNGKEVIKYAKEDVYHCYDEKDPDNDIFGLSILEGLIYDVLADDEASLSNYHYFKNATIPSMLIKVKDDISNNEMDNLVEQMKNNFKGGKNKHKIGLMRGIEGIEKLQESMSDMQYTQLRNFTTERVCAAYGVPKVVLNYTEGVNYTNAEMQYKKYLNNTVIPRERKVERWFNDAMQELFAQEGLQTNLVVLKSTESISREKIDIYEKMVQSGLITVNEARKELGYITYEGIEEADQPLILKTYDLLTDVGLADIGTLGS